VTPSERRSGERPPASDDAMVVRGEEELVTETRPRTAGSVRVRKEVETYPIDKVVHRQQERIDEVGERVPAAEGDSGEIETLEDGSVSIPVFEEELVVTKRLRVTERLILRKTTVVDEHHIETSLRRERVEIEADPGVTVTEGSKPPTPPAT
jgi:uncharacterized protein (TIGR02271 family)